MRPSPSHRSHGVSTIRPLPSHRGHAPDLTIWPRTVRETCCTTPEPPHPGQVLVRKLIRTDGTVKELPRRITPGLIESLIDADTLDVVRLRHMGAPLHVMILDDQGTHKDLPVNDEATRLYHANCIPDADLPPIRGDVVIAPDQDFADE